MTMSAFLYPSVDLGLSESCFELKKRVTTVGRHPSNDVALLLESVSRFHAKIESQDDSYVLHDQNSSNGTFINGERIANPRALTEGDVVSFGRADFVFSCLTLQQRRQKGGGETAPEAKTASSNTSSVRVVGDDQSSSMILSTQLNVESTPLPGQLMPAEERLDVEALSKSNQRLLTLYRLNEVIRASATPKEVLSNVMSLIFDVLPADRGTVMTLDVPSGQLEPQHVRYRQGQQGTEMTISRTIVQKCMGERVAVLSRDAKIDSRFSGSESILASDIRSAMCTPLVSKNKLIGILFIDTKESVRAFNEDDLTFVTSIANDLAMALDNMTLAEENIKNERLAAVGQTIAGLAHNIKNILQLAKGGMELMDSAVAKKTMDDVENFWPVVRRGIDRMQTLTQEMLDYSRQTKPQLHEASVNEVIEDTVRSFQQDHVEAGVNIELQLSRDIPMRKIDPDGLNKSLMNLIGNAVEAMEGMGGTIRVFTTFEKDTISIRVEDNGKGIPRDKAKKIFQPFFTTKGSKGTGLGLSMTKKYIEDMGGLISVESEEGRGTAFTIALPPLVTQIQFETDRDDKTYAS
jgi:signal transduction histidine kinase/pSer/pThr/pTyr-binding forkhead associated (FHA) protein